MVTMGACSAAAAKQSLEEHAGVGMEAWLKQLHAGYARICEGVAGNKGAADEESAQPPVRPKTGQLALKQP